MTEKQARLNVVLPVELKEKIEKKASELGMSVSSYVRFVLINDLKK